MSNSNNMTSEPREKGNIFEFRTTELSALKASIDILKELIDTVFICYNSSGISIKTYDVFRSIYIDMIFDADKLDHYYYRKKYDDDGVEVDQFICVSLQYINTVLKSIKTTDSVIIWSFKERADNIIIEIHSSVKEESREYKIINICNEDFVLENPPSTISDYNYFLMLPCTDLSDIFKDLKQLDSEVIVIKYIDNNLIFDTKTKGPISVSIVRKGKMITEGDLDKILDSDTKDVKDLLILKEPSDDSSSCFYDEYKFAKLYDLSKCSKISDKSKKKNFVEIHIMPEMPIVFTYSIGKLGSIQFYVTANNET